MEIRMKKAFQALIDLFDEIESRYNFPYMIVGGILTPLYSESRQTQDIDLLVRVHMTPNFQNYFLTILKEHGFRPITKWDDIFIDELNLNMIQFLDPAGIVKYDINILDVTSSKYISDTNPYQLIKVLAIGNRKKGHLFDKECWIQGKEDFILSKLVYQGYQDYKDALFCWMRFKDELDMQYLEKNAHDLGVHHLLNAIKQQKPVDEVFND